MLVFALIYTMGLLKEQPEYSIAWYETVALNYSKDEFQLHFRIPKAAFESILGTLSPMYTIMLDIRRAALATLWLLASGSCYRTVSALFAISKTTFCRAAHMICKLVCTAYPDVVDYHKELQ